MTAAAHSPAKPTNRFARRREDILDVASDHINRFGVRGMTLTRIAQDLGIDTSSLTYYFRKREDLAAACLERTLAWQHEAVLAASAGNARSAVRSFLHAYFEVHRASRPANAPRLSYLSDIRSIGAGRRDALLTTYGESFRVIRGWFLSDGQEHARAHIATSVVMAAAHWLSVWVGEYADSDFARLENRLFDLLEHGLGVDGRWSDIVAMPADDGGGPDSGDALARFLHAATSLINRDGYHGASVEKIAAELGVSTGSFYHHLDNKDELVLACFDRHYALIEQAHAAAREQAASNSERLARIASTLLGLQLHGNTPLLGASAYQALPPELRAQVIRRTGQITRHIAGVVADGSAAGEVRAVDPAVASHFFTAVINSASGLRSWRSPQRPADVATRLMHMLERGIF